ncbi:MAG: hypothetical protein DLM73_13910 [Chthoniobacterales bacterium]|nr:MAG: hypothetical protein DLM73_13910 [Chthoniobacterales bacterium]
MKKLRTLYHFARADFLQRTRSYGFLITLGLMLYVAYVFVPPNHSAYATMTINEHRGVYNSAYLGSLMALLISPWLSLAGFYLVKNAIDRDIQTGVGQILAATTLTKPLYTVGKTISNFSVLAIMVGVMGIVAAAMQLVRGEDTRIDFVQLFAPLVLISLPVVAVVGSVAILFEAIPRLRRGLGNVVYFFVWIAALTIRVAGGSPLHSQSNDLFGLGVIMPAIAAACEASFPGSTLGKGSFNLGINFKNAGEYWDLITFQWEGLTWTRQIVLGRLLWLGVSVGIALLAAVFFRRFDPAQESSRRARKAGKELSSPETIEEHVVPDHPQTATLHPLAKSPRFSFPVMVLAELRLALHGVSLWWYLVAAGIFTAGLFTPVFVSRGFLIAAWIWPLLIWSAMGTRETRLRTDQLIFSIAHPLRRQLPACWLAGVIIALLTGGGTGIRLLVAGDQMGLVAWTAGALFIPTMALALGVWSGSSKLFEVLYLLLWYLGPANHLGEIDFMGATGSLLPPRTPLVFLTLTAVLAVFAVAGRKRQLTS